MNCLLVKKSHTIPFLLILCSCFTNISLSQTNLLLNGSFEDINVCTEYKSECGVEGWFYLKDIKVQMLSDYDPVLPLGVNSYGLFYNWLGYEGFTPVIGTLLPCHLQEGRRYTFKGMISAKLNGRLAFKPGVVIGEKFYVPKRAFSAKMSPDSIVQMESLNRKGFYNFEYSFTADGKEKYLTFGTFIKEDVTAGKRVFIGTQSISLVLDNFQLLPADSSESFCDEFMANKDKIYQYDFRHKEMDYSLYGKGDLNILFDAPDSNYITRRKKPVNAVKADTLKLGDVLFDFNKADLKPATLKLLDTYFNTTKGTNSIDSIYIEGHTDSIGSDARNLQLSLRRCQSVQDWLQKNVLSKEQIQIHPFGKTKPAATNSTPEGRALNRRVEMIIFRKAAVSSF
jgi:outer membrane protein OmpA-like peptidoglycan-associated protein